MLFTRYLLTLFLTFLFPLLSFPLVLLSFLSPRRPPPPQVQDRVEVARKQKGRPEGEEGGEEAGEGGEEEGRRGEVAKEEAEEDDYAGEMREMREGRGR